MKRPIIQRSFVLSYVAIAVVTAATGLVLRSMPSISADYNKHGRTSTSSVSATSTGTPSPGSKCLNLSRYLKVEKTDVTTEEKEIFGDNAIAYNVTSAQNKQFKLLLGAKQISSSGDGGTVDFTYGFKNLWSGNYGDNKDGAIMISQGISDRTNDKIGSSEFSWGAAKSSFLVFDHRNKAVAPQEYWYETKQFDVSSYSNNIRLHMLNGGSDGLAHHQVCINNAISLNDLFVTPTPSTTATESTKSLTFKKGFNAVVPPEGYIYDTGAISSAGMYLFDFNRLGQKNWRSTAHGGAIAYMVNQIGYYVYNPSESKTINVATNPSAYVESSEDKIKVRRGWNLLSNPNSSALSLANFYLNTLKKDADATCLDESCYESVTLYSLLSGTAASSRGYGTLYEITDGNASEASKAFTKVNVTASNINSVAISPGRAFWFYLFE